MQATTAGRKRGNLTVRIKSDLLSLIGEALEGGFKLIFGPLTKDKSAPNTTDRDRQGGGHWSRFDWPQS